MNIPEYPEFANLDLSMKDDLHPKLAMMQEGVSEHTFAGLYLFRDKYGYRLSRISDQTLVISGKDGGTPFFMVPCGIPKPEFIEDLFRSHGYIKGLAEPFADESRIFLEQAGYCVQEDRDNFDYLYLRKDLAQLAGRTYHKKRNLVNAFINSYSYREERITPDNVEDTLTVLEQWRRGKDDPGDYYSAREALEKMTLLDLSGCLTYVDGVPAAYSLGERIARGRFFAVHFEKAIGSYKGIYQFINRSFASMLPRYITHINREQDLGDPGLRQAKMTYRPCGFVKKYKVFPAETAVCDENPAPEFDIFNEE